MDRNRISFLLLTAGILCSFCRTLSTAQENTSSNPFDMPHRCGVFGICNSRSSQICSCFPGFSPNNTGCLRRVPLRCDEANNSSSDDGFKRLDSILTPGYSSRWLGPESECRGQCLSNCSCIAYAWVGVIVCMFWIGDLVDFQRVPRVSTALYIRLAKSELGSKEGFKKTLMIPVAVGIAFAFVFSYFMWRWRYKKRGRRSVVLGEDMVDSTIQDAMNKVNLEELPLFKLETLSDATDNFSDAKMLGKGGFGPVYKGQLSNGRKIAVKRLSKASGQGMQEFMNDVVLISKLQHRNLVRLFGCCVENKETMLVYEYMPNKSLDFVLFDQSHDILNWQKRVNIIEGICEGLLYLHRDSRLKIIHRDLKPSNILLDDDWNPKISDFGMARIYGSRNDHFSTVRVVGTYGYMAPEYAMEGRFSEKSDIFSFGVLMLEIAAGRRNSSFNDHNGPVNLLAHIRVSSPVSLIHMRHVYKKAACVSETGDEIRNRRSKSPYNDIQFQVWKMWNEDDIAASIDQRISSPCYQAEVVRCIHIGLLCVQELPKDRPSISNVLSMLRSEIAELPKPKQPAFVLMSRTYNRAASSSLRSEKSSCSANNVTLTEVNGR